MTKCLHVPRIDHCGECSYWMEDKSYHYWHCRHPDGPESATLWEGDMDDDQHIARGIPDGCPLDDADPMDAYRQTSTGETIAIDGYYWTVHCGKVERVSVACMRLDCFGKMDCGLAVIPDGPDCDDIDNLHTMYMTEELAQEALAAEEAPHD